MMDVKPFAITADVDEELMKELVEEYGSLAVIRAICQLLKKDMIQHVEDRNKWLADACKRIARDEKDSRHNPPGAN